MPGQSLAGHQWQSGPGDGCEAVVCKDGLRAPSIMYSWPPMGLWRWRFDAHHWRMRT